MRADWPADTPPAGAGVPRRLPHALSQPVVQALLDSGAQRLLELGCRDGGFASALQCCSWDVLATDADPAVVEWAAGRHPSLPVRQLDVQQPLPVALAGSFDAVLAFGLIERLPQPRRLLDCALAALRPGGYLIVSTPCLGYVQSVGLALANRFEQPWDPLVDAGRLRLYSARSLRLLMQSTPWRAVCVQQVGRTRFSSSSLIATARAPT